MMSHCCCVDWKMQTTSCLHQHIIYVYMDVQEGLCVFQHVSTVKIGLDMGCGRECLLLTRG